MAVVTPRIWDTNYYKAAASTQSADSSIATLPLSYTRDQLRSKVWRSDGPWVVVAGWNDNLDVSRLPGPVVSVATIAAGTYASATLYAAAVVAALEAADSTPVWGCTYSVSTLKFTITSDVAVTLLCNTGASVATSAWKDLGFSTAADNTGTGGLGLSFVADNSVSQSRHYLAVDLGSSLALTAAQALKHNLSGGTITLKSGTTSILNSLTSGNSDSLSLTDSNTAYAYITRTARYVAFLIDDTTNTAGYSEIGVPFVGTYLSPKGYTEMLEEEGDDLSEIANATDGANYADIRAEAKAWRLSWQTLSTSEVATFRTFRTSTPKGKNFFFDLDSTAAVVTTMIYGYRDTPLPVSVQAKSGGQAFNAGFTIRESLL